MEAFTVKCIQPLCPLDEQPYTALPPLSMRRDVHDVNRDQAAYYDNVHQAQQQTGGHGHSENRRSGFVTRIWSRLRHRQNQAVEECGIQERVEAMHLQALRELNQPRVLELGCFSGIPFSFQLIERASDYVGIDLSEAAIHTLETRIPDEHKDKVTLIAGDILDHCDDLGEFDLIYAHGVLHHFKDPNLIFATLHRLSAPKGRLIFYDPSQCFFLHRWFRKLYRPFQSDAAWEWPFTRNTVNAMCNYFHHDRLLGWGKFSHFIVALTGLPFVGRSFLALYKVMVESEIQNCSPRSVWKNCIVTGIAERRRSPGTK